MPKKTTFKEQVYEYLKKAIVKGDLIPGEIYSEQMFADKLNVSRTPVREAVLQLKNEALLEIFHNRGFSLKPLCYEDVKQVMQAQTVIEGYSIRYLTQHIRSTQDQQIYLALDDCLRCANDALKNHQTYYEYVEACIAFHCQIVHFTKNTYFIKTFDMLQNRIIQAITASLTSHDHCQNILAEHEKLLAIIKSGDEHNAVQTFETQMQAIEKIIQAHLTK